MIYDSIISPPQVCMDYTSLYPSPFPMLQKVAAKTIGANLATVQPMSSPSGIMPYMDFTYEEEWEARFKKLSVVIRVKIKDTFENFLDFIERPDIILFRINEMKMDIKFPGSAEFWRKYSHDFETLGMTGPEYQKTIENLFAKGTSIIGHSDPPGELGEEGFKWVSEDIVKDNKILFDVLIAVPYSDFSERFNFANFGYRINSMWPRYYRGTKKDLEGEDLYEHQIEEDMAVNGVSCDKFIEYMTTYKKKEEN